MNPVLTFELENGKNIVVELLPDNAPNAVNSILSVAMRGGMDNHKILGCSLPENSHAS